MKIKEFYEKYWREETVPEQDPTTNAIGMVLGGIFLFLVGWFAITRGLLRLPGWHRRAREAEKEKKED